MLWFYPHVSVMTFINDWVAVEASLAQHHYTCVCLQLCLLCLLLKMAFFTCGLKRRVPQRVFLKAQ